MESRVNNEPRPCHHFRLVFTDGACRLNGQVGATAGIGIAYGEETGSQRATSITSLSDPGQKRTSQRAELLAALAGLRVLGAAHQLNEKESVKTEAKSRRSQDSKEKVWVIATDSEYVVKGMTEWLPSWKVKSLYVHCLIHWLQLNDQVIEADLAVGIEQQPPDQPQYQTRQSGPIRQAGRRNHRSGDGLSSQGWLLACPART